MRTLRNILIIFSILWSGVFSLDAQKKVVTSIEIPASKTLYTMKYNPDGKLSELTFQKKDSPFGSGYKITYPSSNTIVCEMGGISFENDVFDRFFTDKVVLEPSSGDFKVFNESDLGQTSQERVFNVTKGGIEEDGEKLISLKWTDNSISEIDWDGEIYEYKYSDKPYSYSQSGSWDWLMFVINYIVPNDYLEYWFVGEPFVPFSRYPSEVIYRTDNGVKKYVIDYLFSPDGSITVDCLCMKDGETFSHYYLNVNFSVL